MLLAIETNQKTGCKRKQAFKQSHKLGPHESWHQTSLRLSLARTSAAERASKQLYPPSFPNGVVELSSTPDRVDLFSLALCKCSQSNCFQMAVCGGYIHHSTGTRGSSGGLSKAFCSTDEGISCLDLGGLTICSWVGVCMVVIVDGDRTSQFFWGFWVFFFWVSTLLVLICNFYIHVFDIKKKRSGVSLWASQAIILHKSLGSHKNTKSSFIVQFSFSFLTLA